MTDRDDPIIDACLDEVLGGRTPPDLSARILAALEARARASQGLNAAPAAAVNGQTVSIAVRPAARKGRRRELSHWLSAAVAIGGIGLALGLAALYSFGPWEGDQDRIARQKQRPRDTQREVAKHDNRRQPVVPPERKDSGSVIARNDSVPQVIPLDVPRAEKRDDETPPAVAVRPDPIPETEILSFVSDQMRRSWTEHGVTPAAQAKDNEWCRRVYLRLLGRIPTAAEVTAFVGSKSPDKRAKLVDDLLSSPAYADQLAQHWAEVWSNTLIGRTGAQDSLASREGLEQYLAGAIRENKPYDEIVKELLTATGANKPGAPDYNGAVNFLLAGLDADASLATARVSRVFLGHQLQCAQCHNYENWSQQNYWALNSFLRQAQARREGDVVLLEDADFVNRQGITRDGEVYYQLPNKELKAAEPEFIDGTKIPPSGRLAEVNRRQELAKAVARSQEMPRALVNRLWSHFFGYGFTKPLDDMGPHNVPSHPAVLDKLAEQFAAHDYDLKQAMRWIVLSEPFGKSSEIPGGGLADSPQAGTAPLFSHYYTRPMAAEEVYGSLVAAADLRQKNGGNAAELQKARVDWLAQQHRQMGTDDGAEEGHEGVNQQLMMMNSPLTRRIGGELKKMIDSDLPMQDKIDHLFLSALSRKPTAQEQQAIAKITANAGDDTTAALEDIWWALLNSNEFVLDH